MADTQLINLVILGESLSNCYIEKLLEISIVGNS